MMFEAAPPQGGMKVDPAPPPHAIPTALNSARGSVVSGLTDELETNGWIVAKASTLTDMQRHLCQMCNYGVYYHPSSSSSLTPRRTLRH